VEAGWRSNDHRIVWQPSPKLRRHAIIEQTQ
jgi:hypothetical protein